MSVFGTTLIIGASVTVAAVGVAVVAAPEAVGAVSGMPAALQVNTNTAGAVQGGIRDFAVSGNGRYVTFNGAPDQYGAGCTLAVGVCGTRLYAKDLTTGVVAPVGDPATAGTYPNGNALASAMDFTGRYVAFVSTASNLVSGEGAAGAYPQVFIRDRDTDGNGIFDEPGKTSLKLLSRDWDITPGPGALQPAGVDTFGIALSADAKYLSYVATENGNQVVHVIDRNFDHSGHMDDDHDTVNRRIATFPGTTPLSLTDMSPDGRYVVVGQRTGVGSSIIIDRDSDHNGVYDESKTITTSTLPAGLQAISITGDGRKVLVQTNASYNAYDTTTSGDGYIYDRDADANGAFDETGSGKTSMTLVTQRADGTVPTDGGVQRLADGMSRDGRFVLFSSQAVNATTLAVSGDGFTGDDTNGLNDYFVRDLATKTVTRISDVATGYTASIDAASLSGRVGRSAMLEGNVAVFNAIKGTATDTFTQAVGTARTWSVSGPTGSTLTNAGGAGHPQFTYNVNLGTNGTGVTDRTWTFSSTVPTAGSVVVPYTYAGFHSNSKATAHLAAFITHNGVTTPTTLVTAGPSNGTSSPAGGFSFVGSYSFDVVAGDVIGFTLGGSNLDKNSQLNGVFTLSPQPFIPTAPQTAFTPSSLGTIADNTSWVTATTIGSATVTGALLQPGEARWYKFPVTPSSQVKVDLGNLPQNYDLTMYGDIGAAFSSLTSTQDLTKLSAQFAGSAYAPSIYSPSIYSPSIYSPSIYSPSIYSPSIYSPSIYSPSIYSPSIYSPSIYSPSIYSPSIYSPSIYSPSIYSPSIYSPTSAFTQAFSSAQTRSLLAVSANEGTSPESIRVSTWNNTGFFYVRVLGRNGASDPLPFTLGLTTSGGPCANVTLDPHATDRTLYGVPDSVSTVILTDSTRWDPAASAGLRAKLDQLATATNGAVVDVSGSDKVNALNQQADGAAGCPYAKNLVAQSIRDIVNTYRGVKNMLKYVVVVGGDSIIPFFRYADGAGIGPESDYVPPVQDPTPAQASLRSNYVFGQDAYGSQVDLPMQGGVLPVADLAVGRLVETPSEIAGVIDAYLGLAGGVLPTPKSSLVTGYDFLQSAADSVNADFTAGLGAGATTDSLITDQGVPSSTTTVGGKPKRSTSWTATDFSNSLLSSGHHDLVFLAGHFSANSTLAADYTTSFVTNQLDATRNLVDPSQNLLWNSLVISAGCHSAYNIQDSDGFPYLTNGLDWAEEMALQRATFVGGTGYQYADTDFLAYSAKLYSQMAQQLRTGSGAVAVGDALVRAKKAYLQGLSSVSGIDQKALIEATVYGLPMISVNMPGARIPAPASGGTALTPAPVGPATPGGQLGLQTVPYDVSATLDADNTPAGTVWTKSGADPVTGTANTTLLQWHTGRDGVQSGAGLPTLPKQIDNVTSTNGTVLRGVGFRSGSYTDQPGVTPLTGAPTTEQNGVHTSFGAGSFFPQKLTSVNYFDSLGTSGDGSTTKLVTTPVQYRAEVGKTTDTERVYQHLGLSLFYSSNFGQYGQNTPALAAPPSITGVTANTVSGGTAVVVSAHITGDPSAGIQQVWVTYTGEAGPFHGTWASVDLIQDLADSTLWTGRINLPSQQNAGDVRLIVQAVNGVGVVGLDNNFGDGYTPDIFVGSVVRTASITSTLVLDSGVPSHAPLGSTVHVGATLSGAATGTPVVFSIGSASATGLTDAVGHAKADITLHDQVGDYTFAASYAGDTTHVPVTASTAFTIDRLVTTLKLTVVSPSKTTQASALLTGPHGEALAHEAVLLSLTGPGYPTATPLQIAASTDGNGQVVFDRVLADGTYTLTAAFAGTPSTFQPWSDTATIVIDTTAPVVTVASQVPLPNSAGWNNQQVVITWACTDVGSGVQTCPGPTTVTADGSAQVVTSDPAIDKLGNTSTGTTTVSIDTVGPTLTPTQSPTANAAGWNNTAVDVTWKCSDATSGLAACPGKTTVGETPNAGVTVPGTATDVAGNSTSSNFGPVKVDLTKPVITGVPTVPANSAGWYKNDVTIHWTCTDAGGSGIPANGCPADSTIGGEGVGLNVGAGVTDVAGNEQTASSATVQIDRTPPTTGTDAKASWYSTDVTINLLPTDNLSLPGQTYSYYQLDPKATSPLDSTKWTLGTAVLVSGTGTHTIYFYSVDYAGNVENVQSISVKIDADAPTITHTISPAPGTDGWNNTDVTVAFTCSSASGITSCTAPQPIKTEGRDQQVLGSATNTVGRTAPDVALVSIDRTAPTVVGAPTTSAINGWYNNPVLVHFTCVDPPLPGGGTASGVATCSDDVTLAANAAGQSVSGSGADKAGNSATATSSLVSIDQVPPTISVAPTTQPNAAGWYKGAVTFHFTCADTLSGLASCPADKTIFADGTNLTVTGDAFDVAGNKASVVSAPVKIDSSVPNESITGVKSGAFYTTAPKPGCATTDPLSGVANNASLTVSGTGGSVTATCTGATDIAGNTAASVSVTYLVIGSVKVSARFTPGGTSSIVGDVLPGLNGTSTASLTASAFYASTGALNASVSFVYNITNGLKFTSTSVSSFTMNGADSWITGVGTIAGRTGTFPFQVFLHSGVVAGSGPSRAVVTIYQQTTTAAPTVSSTTTPTVLYQASGNLASTDVKCGRDD